MTWSYVRTYLDSLEIEMLTYKQCTFATDWKHYLPFHEQSWYHVMFGVNSLLISLKQCKLLGFPWNQLAFRSILIILKFWAHFLNAHDYYWEISLPTKVKQCIKLKSILQVEKCIFFMHWFVACGCYIETIILSHHLNIGYFRSLLAFKWSLLKQNNWSTQTSST